MMVNALLDSPMGEGYEGLVHSLTIIINRIMIVMI